MIQDIDQFMPYPTKPVPNNLDDIMRGYYNQAWSDIDNYVNQSLVTSNYSRGTAAIAYQNVLNRTSALFNTGIYTFEESVEKAIIEMAQKGIKSTFTNNRGRSLSIEGYTRTVLKSTLGNTFNEVRTERMADYGVYTVVVTSLAGARDQCSIIQGHVVDLRLPSEIPEASEYKSIYDQYWKAEYGTAGGHRGANCRHLHIPFIPGVNTNNQPHYDKELNERVAKARDTQRRIEREIVKYKKNLMIAEELGSKNVAHWSMMVRRRQAAMRKHLEENGDYLSRNYGREKVYTPLRNLLEDFSYSK
ncbi:phage minor capsid protein [Bacillus sp. JCM 19034]|uniref:phage minor capsid protein n=1 Tax=Bacillus sp. JCM 19034 TaxID=1481928 RepID=UPI000A61EA71|nr:phage minor capsid protein [Bacillus sp. JCM 19034]